MGIINSTGLIGLADLIMGRPSVKVFKLIKEKAEEGVASAK